MKTTFIYKIGTYKSGQQIADEVFASENLQEVELEFKRMFNATEFCPNGTDNQADDAEQAWQWKKFSVDTKNVGVFFCKENENLHTHWTYQDCESNQIL